MRGTIVTLNCGKSRQSPALLKQLFDSLNLVDSDFLALGLQEICPLMESLLQWQESYLAPFEQAISERYSQFKWSGISVVGSTAVIVWTCNIPRNVDKTSASFGIGWSSLKGAAAIKVDGIVFVSAHLAANEGRVNERNQHCALIASRLRFLDGTGIYTCNSLFLFGDLNYRVTKENTDELTLEKSKGKTLWGLDEAHINFKPTYKFLPNTNLYNNKRKPSWCDRILFSNAQPLIYDSIFSYRVSDHRPVYLAVTVPSGDTEEIKLCTDKISSGELYPNITLVSNLVIGRSLWAFQTWRGRGLLVILLLLLWVML